MVRSARPRIFDELTPILPTDEVRCGLAKLLNCTIDDDDEFQLLLDTVTDYDRWSGLHGSCPCPRANYCAEFREAFNGMCACEIVIAEELPDTTLFIGNNGSAYSSYQPEALDHELFLWLSAERKRSNGNTCIGTQGHPCGKPITDGSVRCRSCAAIEREQAKRLTSEALEIAA
jgi:hypothetical protein